MKALLLSILMGMATLAPVLARAQSCAALYSSKYDTLVMGVSGSAMTLTATTVSTTHTVSTGTTAWATASTLTGGKMEVRIIESNETLDARIGYVYVEYGASCRDSVVLFQPGKTCEQGIDGTEGQRFFVAFSENIYQTPSSPPQTRLIMTAAETTSGTISNPRTGWSQTFTIPANTVIQVTIAHTHAYNTDGETVSNRGLIVATAKKISLYASNSESTSSDATNVLPVEALGDEYYSLSYNGHRSTNSTNTPEEFLIVATEDNTLITIVPAGRTGGVSGMVASKAEGDPFNIRLQKGQTYLVKSYISTNNTDPTLGTYYYRSISGSYIKSNKLIAVFAGHKRAQIGCSSGNGSRDNLFQQLAPLRLWGYHYAVIPASLSQDRYRIVAAYDNTTFSINGTLQTPLNRSAYCDYTVQQGSYAYIESDQPIEVGLMGKTQDCAPVTSVGDPFLVVVNPVENEITSVTFAALPLSAILQQYVNIIVQQSAKTATTLTVATTGVNVPLTFTDISGSNYAYARVQIATGSYRLHNPVGFTAYVYGFGNAESYAYSVGARFNHLTPPSVTADTSYCVGQPLKPLSAYDAEGNFLWYASADDETALGAAPTISTDTPGTYTFYVSRLVECSESPRRPVTVQVHPLPAITFADTSLCNSDSAVSLALPSGGSYTGAGCMAGHFYPANAGAGTHTLAYTYRDQRGCVNSAAANVTVWPLPTIPIVNVIDSASLCDDAPVTLSANAAGAAIGQWYKNGVAITDSTRLQLVVSESGAYSVTVTSADGCAAARGSDTITVVMYTAPGLPVVSTTDMTTFCHGRWATLQASSSEAVVWQWYCDGVAVPDSIGARFTAVSTGSYAVRITNANGCLSGISIPVMITTYPLTLPVIATVDPLAFCDGQSTTLTAEAAEATVWQWYKDGVAITDSVNRHFAAVESGSYTVVVQDIHGCLSATSAPTVVTVYPLPTAPVISVAGNAELCTGDSVKLTSAGTDNLACQWFRDGNPIPDAVVPDYLAYTGGAYTLAVKDEHHCVPVHPGNTLTIIVHPLPATPHLFSTDTLAFCTGGQALLESDAPDAVAYQWYHNGTAIPFATAATYRATISGVYTLRISDSHACRSSGDSETLRVIVHDLPLAPVIVADGPPFYQGWNYTLKIDMPENDVSYHWYKDGVPTGIVSVQWPLTELDNTQTGTYAVEAELGEGCPIRSAPFTVTMDASPLFIPNVFTPNGDGVNDDFHIAGLDNYDGNELLIINKRGKTVFSAVDYHNEWDGQDLPDDTYYYRLSVKEKDGSETYHQGYVNIKRR
ncbi:MAG: gliding motility-associated C-terminal domain-containing protein [Prevotellaceae bacterium]|jgi:gliding motility-associated-like protein|nr:gliding motility-associated C-terminal domain-containing protein [Prevotellaceae bacterium]